MQPGDVSTGGLPKIRAIPDRSAVMSFELNKRLAARRAALVTDASVDPVSANIIRGALETICFEAATHLGRAASSPIINQSNERNASIIDAHGRLAAGSIGTPHLTFISQLTVRYGLEYRQEYDWGPGDVFVGNDPDHGGGHLPDYNVYAPVFDERGELVLIQALQAHQGDTGGKDQVASLWRRPIFSLKGWRSVFETVAPG